MSYFSEMTAKSARNSSNSYIDEMRARGWWNRFKTQTIDVNGQPYEEGQYTNLQNADPYANWSYKMGPWESFLQSLGFRTKYDKQKEELALASQAYQADVALKEYDESYDSPAAQAARMRAAGQNPDLLGTSGVQSAAQMNVEDNPIGSVAGEDIVSDPANFANFIMSSLTAAVGFSKDFGALKSIFLDNEAKSISNSGDMMRLAFDSILNYTSIFPEKDDNGNVSDRFDGAGVYDAIARDYKNAWNRKSYSRFMNQVGTFINSMKTKDGQYKLNKEYLESMHDFYLTNARPDYSENEIEYTTTGVAQILANRAEQMYQVDQKNLENQLAEGEVRDMQLTNQMDYEVGFDGSSAAAAENAENEYTRQNKQTAANLESTLNEITNYLKKQSEKGNRFASIALAIISLGRLMSVSASSSPKGAKLGVGF